MAPTLTGRGVQAKHGHLYWELREKQALRRGDWKLVRLWSREKGAAATVTNELYNLAEDIAERNNLAGERPEVLAKMLELARKARSPSKEFPAVYDREGS